MSSLLQLPPTRSRADVRDEGTVLEPWFVYVTSVDGHRNAAARFTHQRIAERIRDQLNKAFADEGRLWTYDEAAA